MPKLHLDKYHAALIGKTVWIACREGILRDHFADIISDIKFLNRQGVSTLFFHNMSNRFANRRHFAQLAAKLPQTRIQRVPADTDFYEFVLNFREPVNKLIFLERRYLVDEKGHKINALNTESARKRFDSYGDVIANLNFKGIIGQICQRLEKRDIERVHILPAGRHSIKYELFTVEGSGTLIANNFNESFEPLKGEQDIRLVGKILKHHMHLGYLKQRNLAYVRDHCDRFFVVKIDGIIVGCGEKIELDPQTIELGALAIAAKFRNQRVGLFYIRYFIEEMRRQGYMRLVTLTGNPKLAGIYRAMGFEQAIPGDLRKRSDQSPQADMYVKVF